MRETGAPTLSVLQIFHKIYASIAVFNDSVAYVIAKTAIEANVFPHGLIGIDTDLRISRFSRERIHKFHDGAPMPFALKIRMDAQSIKKQMAVPWKQNHIARYFACYCGREKMPRANMGLIIIQHWKRFAIHARHIYSKGIPRYFLNSCQIFQACRANQTFVLICHAISLHMEQFSRHRQPRRQSLSLKSLSGKHNAIKASGQGKPYATPADMKLVTKLAVRHLAIPRLAAYCFCGWGSFWLRKASA